MDQKTWFITGISSGLGQALAQAVMATGDFVVGTFRQPQQVERFNAEHPHNAFAFRLDLANEDLIDHVARQTLRQFGKIDVLVNNAGVGFGGAIEESSLSEARVVFDTNFFGALKLTQAFLPTFRQHRSGHIVQISSHGGIKATAGFGIYNASKFALEGFSEALAEELAPLGINVTIVEPGPFRTSFASSNFRIAKASIADYNATAGVFLERIKQVDGKQEGDPIKAAQAIIAVVNAARPTLRLPLGRVAIGTITSKLASVQNDLDTHRELAEQAVY